MIVYILIGVALLLFALGLLSVSFRKPPGKPQDPHWESHPLIVGIVGFKVIGYGVRWSVPDERGVYFYHHHYYVNKDLDRDAGFCEECATLRAESLNREKIRPGDLPRHKTSAG